MYKTFTEGQTKTFALSTGDVDVYAKTVFRTGDSGEGYVEIELGADKLTFEHGDNVKYGADNDDIEGTLVYFDESDATAVQDLSSIKVAIFAEDDDVNHVLVGEAFTDPVFKSMSINLASVANGPEFVDEKDPATIAGRTEIAVEKGGDRELQLRLTAKGSSEQTIPFTYNDALTDDNGDRIVLEEGAIMEKDDYFILNAGDYQHFMEITKLSIDEDDVSDDDITFKDLLTGTNHEITDKNLGATNYTTITINSQTYTVWSMNASWINVTSEDSDTNIALWPYVELVSGKDTRAAMVDAITISTDGNVIQTATNDTDVNGLIYDLPSGTIQFRASDAGNADPNTTTVDYRIDGGSWVAAFASGTTGQVDTASVAVGTVVYTFSFTYVDVDVSNVTLNNVTIQSDFATSAGEHLISPGLLLIEEEDKSEANSDVKNSILINTTDDGSTYSQVMNIQFSDTVQRDTESWDDTDYTGYLTNFGSYVLLDSKDDNQKFASIVYPNAHMYAEVFFSEEGAVITAGTTGGATVGNIVVKDSEVSSVAANNLIVIGGSCINSAAATLVGSAHCGASWTEATGVGSGEFLIKGYSDSALAPGKLAVLVAGYEAADTVNAATYLRTQTVDTDKEYKGTSSTSAELVVAA